MLSDWIIKSLTPDVLLVLGSLAVISGFLAVNLGRPKVNEAQENMAALDGLEHMELTDSATPQQ